jgi:molybdenum cofactor cytidylyltransferase
VEDPFLPAPSGTAVIVLAAGQSSRMGALKPLMSFGQTTVLGHLLATVAKAAIGPAFVVVGNERDRMIPAVEAYGATVVVNAAFADGMLSSVKAGIEALPDGLDGVLVLPADMPLIRATTLAELGRQAVETGADILRPTFRGRSGHPPFIRRRLFADILTASDGTTLREMLDGQQGALAVPVFDSGILRDMDYPGDYRRLAASLPHREHPDEAECEAMLDANHVPQATRRHCHAVARLAGELAQRLEAGGLRLDADVVRAGALLHDIAKGQPDHAAVGARYVAGLGFVDVAGVVADHTEVAFTPGQALDERHLVFLADKMIRGERRVGLEERFAPGLAAFATDPAALAAARSRRSVAHAVLAAVEAVAGPLGNPPCMDEPFVSVGGQA